MMGPPKNWPLASHGQRIRTTGMDWYVVTLGKGPVLLLLHGTGASGHSFAGIAEALADEFTLVIPDLPGQGFSQLLPAADTHLAGFAQRLQELLSTLNVTPEWVIGHSAGAALGTYCALTQRLTPKGLIGINGAYLPFGSVAAPVFSSAAKLMARSKLLAWVTAAHGLFERPIRNLLKETGSEPTDDMVFCYKTLLSKPQHITGTLRMMAGWRLQALKARLPQLTIPLELMVCTNDQTVSPWQSERLAELVASSRLHYVHTLGHLGHEEQPVQFADAIKAIINA